MIIRSLRSGVARKMCAFSPTGPTIISAIRMIDRGSICGFNTFLMVGKYLCVIYHAQRGKIQYIIKSLNIEWVSIESEFCRKCELNSGSEIGIRNDDTSVIHSAKRTLPHIILAKEIAANQDGAAQRRNNACQNSMEKIFPTLYMTIGRIINWTRQNNQTSFRYNLRETTFSYSMSKVHKYVTTIIIIPNPP
jgi:hypothetical protein